LSGKISSSESETARAISREMVALVKSYMGRGPTEAKTYLYDDIIVVVLHDVLTQAERSLAAGENEELVGEIRRTFKDAVGDSAIAAIERRVGRQVISFMSDHDIENEYAVQVFVLATSNETVA